ncbi:MAG: BlaI/MecI/CopY family transcriptional regulator [Bacteroidales bacterium]|nr:BlaI/MecI/CopY family transcriptional regulator [Bacteroidales bacterium]
MSKKETKIRRLTRAEEEVMQILWDMEEGVVKDIVEKFDDPKPAYTTIATVLKVLERKSFVEYKTVGNTYLYFPMVSKTDYTKFQLSSLLKNYFNGSFPKMATFFARENDLTLIELEEILKEAMKDINKEQYGNDD